MGRMEICILIAGIALRIWYFIVTPLGLRGHDTGTHLDYIKYLVEHAALPPVIEGWEFHQAPLYYVLSAMLWSINAGLGIADATTLWALQSFSLLLSIGTLIIALLIGRMLFTDTRSRATFGALIATLPGLLFLIGEASNETLHHSLMFLGFFLMLRWWQSGRTFDLIVVTVVIAVAILTKITSIILVAALLCCILARPKTSRRERWRALGITVAVLTLLCGWFIGLRVSQHAEMQDRLAINAAMEPVQRMQMENDPSYFLQFSPLMIVEQPFNAIFDTDQRRFFWEYLFRSAWFGEWTFADIQPLGSSMMALGLILLAVAACGAWRDIRRKPTYAFPVVITGLLLPLGLLSYRIALPCACNQDFRFISLLSIPMAYFALRGISALPKNIGIVGYVIAWLTAAASTIFILSL